MLKLSWHLNLLSLYSIIESGMVHNSLLVVITLPQNSHIFFNDRTILIVLYVEDFLNGLLTTVKSTTSIPMIHYPASAKQTSSLF